MSKTSWFPMTEEEYGEALRKVAEMSDMEFTEAGSIEQVRCGYCGTVIVHDPTDHQSWVHFKTGDAQCIVDEVRLDAWAIPVRTTSA